MALGFICGPLWNLPEVQAALLSSPSGSAAAEPAPRISEQAAEPAQTAVPAQTAEPAPALDPAAAAKVVSMARRLSLGAPVRTEYPFMKAFRTDFEQGSLIRVPELNRIMTLDNAVAESAVVIGDSQTGPDTWVDQGLKALGYQTILRGAGGTGYTVGNGSVGSYRTALVHQQWLLPWGDPALVVLEGGGNDAGASTDGQIAQAAADMIDEMRRTYPQSRLVMVGVISSPLTDYGSQRTAVDHLLADTAASKGVQFLSVGDWWDRYSLGTQLADGRHFTDAGQKAAGAVLARELGALLDEQEPEARGKEG